MQTGHERSIEAQPSHDEREVAAAAAAAHAFCSRNMIVRRAETHALRWTISPSCVVAMTQFGGGVLVENKSELCRCNDTVRRGVLVENKSELCRCNDTVRRGGPGGK